MPKANPIAMSPHLPLSNRTIVHFLDKRMKEADCAIFLAGVYASNSEWMQSEIEAAQEYGTPIIGVRPLGQQRVSTIVQWAAGENMVYWNASSIAEAIRRVVRKRAVASFAEAAQRANQVARIQNFAISPPPSLATTPPPPGPTSLGTVAAPNANVLAALRNTSQALSRPAPIPLANSLSLADLFTSKGR